MTDDPFDERPTVTRESGEASGLDTAVEPSGGVTVGEGSPDGEPAEEESNLPEHMTPAEVMPRDSTRKGREEITMVASEETKHTINDVLNEYQRQYSPSVKKMDLYAAIIYAGMPGGPGDIDTYLEAMGYTSQ